MGEVWDLFGHRAEVEEDVDRDRERFPRLPRYAEFMVCAFLTRLGYYCVHVDTMGFDIIMDYEGRSYRIDVKATANYQRGALRESCEWGLTKASYVGPAKYKGRAITSTEVDLLALYHLEFDTVIFVPVLRPMRKISFPAGQVRSAGDGAASLAVAIEQLGGGDVGS